MSFHETSVLLVLQHAQRPDGFWVTSNLPQHWTETFQIHYHSGQVGRRGLSGQKRGEQSEKTILSRITRQSGMGRTSLLPKSSKHKPKKASAMLYNLKYWIPINNSTSNRTKRKFLYLNWGEGNDQYSFLLKGSWWGSLVNSSFWTWTERRRLKWRERNWPR